MAARRLEHGALCADEGGARDVTPKRTSDLSGQLHDVGQDLKVIAVAIAVLVEGIAQE